MAVISITAANVVASAQATIRKEYNAGATITAGQAVYLNSSNLWVLADSDAAVTGNSQSDLLGIALNGASSGQSLAVALEDPAFTPGGTLTKGSTIYTSTTAGGITLADIPTTAAYPVSLGIAISTSQMYLRKTAAGVVI